MHQCAPAITLELVPQPMSMHTGREAIPPSARAKRTADRARAVARV